MSMDTDHEATEVAAEDDDAKSAVEDHEVEPDPPPPPLALPPWIGASIDTNDHLLQYYLPAERGLGHFTTTRSGWQRIDSLTTRQLMEYRILWDQGI
eukprot:11111913-Heterocapsa_arctica.AAC.1